MEVINRKDLERIECKLDFLIEQLSNNKEVFNTKEAADYLGISDGYLRRNLVNQGKIKFTKKGTHYLFSKDWLDDWLEYGRNK